MENWCENTIEMKNYVLRIAIDLKLYFETNPQFLSRWSLGRPERSSNIILNTFSKSIFTTIIQLIVWEKDQVIERM